MRSLRVIAEQLRKYADTAHLYQLTNTEGGLRQIADELDDIHTATMSPMPGKPGTNPGH